MRLLKIANLTMLLTFCLTASAIILVYGFDHYLSLGMQIFGHVVIMILPAFFKLSYVIRLSCLRSLAANEHMLKY